MSKTKETPFIVFVEQRRKREEGGASGRKYSLQEAVHKFGPEWTIMSPEEREPFIRQAGRKSSATTSVAGPPPKVKKGISSSLHREEVLKEVQRLNWQKHQSHRLTTEECGDPVKYHFVHIHVTLYAKTEEGIYIPGEIGIAVFSLQQGLLDNYWTLIDPGACPLGAATLFKESRLEHFLPEPPFNAEFANYHQIWSNLETFLKLHRSPITHNNTYLFTGKNEVPIVLGALKWLAGRAGGRNVPWQVFSYGSLLYDLSKLGRRRYIEWINKQRMRDIVTNPNCRWLPPKPETEKKVRGPAINFDFNPTMAPSTSHSSLMSAQEQLNDFLGDTCSSIVEAPEDEPESLLGVCCWTAEEEAIPDVDLNMMDTSVPTYVIPNYFGKARQLPRTMEAGEVDLLDLEDEDGDDDTSDDTSSVTSFSTDPMTFTYRPPTKHFRPNELFMLEREADDFLASMDFASMAELACPFHMVNTEGVSLCPLSIVNRNVFNTIDVLIGYFHIPAREGSHYPHREPGCEAFRRLQNVIFYAPCHYTPRLFQEPDPEN